MHIKSTLSVLEITHCIGQKKPSSKKPRAVIIKFFSYSLRKKNLNKKHFKGTQVSMTENLTAKRIGILKEAREKHIFCNM